MESREYRQLVDDCDSDWWNIRQPLRAMVKVGFGIPDSLATVTEAVKIGIQEISVCSKIKMACGNEECLHDGGRTM